MPLPSDKNWLCRLGVFVSLLLLATMIRPTPNRAADESSRRAETFLRRDRGLTRVPGGDVWLSTSEYQVRENLRGLDDARRDVVIRQRELDERARRNRVTWETCQRQIAALRNALSSPEADDADKRKIRQRIEEWRSRAIDPKKLAAEPDVRLLLIQLINDRDRLALTLISLRRSIPRIGPEYERLAADDEVQAALRQLGPSHRLGPLSENYGKELRRLPDYERIVFTPWVPVYLHRGRVRVGLIVNERTPVTFTWQDSNDPLVMPDTIAEAAGIERAARGEPAVPIQLGRGRRLLTHSRTVSAIRLGKYVLGDVPCLVLPPEAEDVGAQIGIDAWSGYDAKVELERFRIFLQPH